MPATVGALQSTLRPETSETRARGEQLRPTCGAPGAASLQDPAQSILRGETLPQPARSRARRLFPAGRAFPARLSGVNASIAVKRGAALLPRPGARTAYPRSYAPAPLRRPEQVRPLRPAC